MILLYALMFSQLFFLFQPSDSNSKNFIPCERRIKSSDSFLVATSSGKILFEKNAGKQRVPASTLKVLTALAVLDHFGPSYRFQTEFYMDPHQNLKIKGYGDPLLISEVLHQIADIVSKRTASFRNIILDDTYFSSRISVPGCENTTNPYDAPIGALCANFNTVAFKFRKNKPCSTESQTPMVPFMAHQIRTLDLQSGRRTFTHNSKKAALYVGELLRHLLKKRGVKTRGTIRFGAVLPTDTLIFTYKSIFSLETVVQKMLHSSSNFMANQIFVALGASVYGPPGTLAKGIRATQAYIKKELGPKYNIKLVEGSGLSRQNHLSAYDMLAILEKFKPYRNLLKRQDQVLYKTGSLKGISARAGYIEGKSFDSYYFAVFFNRTGSNIAAMVNCIKKAIGKAAGSQRGLIKVHPRRDTPTFSNITQSVLKP